jgi:predicted polyphosphate/ATP-dependent NAD kinase
MDIDEESYRQGVISARLYGYLRVPFRRNLMQSLKTASNPGERASLDAIATAVIGRMQSDCLYIIGPGTTTRAITDRLGLLKTLLGVDVIQNNSVIAFDTGERELLGILENHENKRTSAFIIVTPIGGQGFILGRGNQQISPAVIRKVGKDRLMVVSTSEKVHSLGGRPLLVDTGERELDQDLSGYIRVLTGYNEEIVYRISSDY